MKYILLLSLIFMACGSEKKEKKEEIIIPKSALFVIQDQPRTAAYKTDTSQAWVVIDTAATLKVLLQSVEDNYKRAIQMQQLQKK